MQKEVKGNVNSEQSPIIDLVADEGFIFAGKTVDRTTNRIIIAFF